MSRPQADLLTSALAMAARGWHLYFRAPGSPIPNSAGRLAPLIAIRANGGYVVAAGSNIGDRTYAARNTVNPSPLPDWLADKLTPQPPAPLPVHRVLPAAGSTQGTAYAMTALRNETHLVATAVDGTRHDTLTRAAFNLGQLVGSGLLPELAVVTSLADAARQSGLPERDIPRIIQSGMTAGTRRPRQNPQRHAPRRPQLPRDGPLNTPYRTDPATPPIQPT